MHLERLADVIIVPQAVIHVQEVVVVVALDVEVVVLDNV